MAQDDADRPAREARLALHDDLAVMLVGNLGGARQLVGGKLRAVHAAAVAVAALEDRRPDVLGSWRVPDLVGLILLEVADRDRQPGRTAEVHVAPLVGVDLFERRQAEAAAQVRLGLAARPPVEPLDEQVVLVVRHRAVGERQRLVAIVVVQRVHGRDNEQQLRGRTARGREAVERQAQPEILLEALGQRGPEHTPAVGFGLLEARGAFGQAPEADVATLEAEQRLEARREDLVHGRLQDTPVATPATKRLLPTVLTTVHDPVWLAMLVGPTASTTSRSMTTRDYDIVVLGDFRFPGGTSTAVAEELAAGAAAGYRTALVQIKGPVLKYPHPFHPRIRACIDDRRVDLVDPDQPVTGRLLLAHHPSLFTHRLLQGLHLSAERKLLVVWHPPLDGAGSPAYDWASVDRNARALLGDDLLWAPVGPLVRAQFETVDDGPRLFADDWHSVVDPDAWRVDRRRFVESRPVIGRHSRPDPLKWPDSRELTLAAYPDDPRFLVRVLGGGPYLHTLLGVYPRNWQVYGFNAMPAERFLGMIDFFVYFHHSRWVEAFGRTIIEAMASGALAILAPHFRALFGTPRSTPSRMRRRTWCRATAPARSASGSRSSAAGRRSEPDFSRDAYIRRLQALIGPPRAITATVPARSRAARFACSWSRPTASGSAI